MSSASYDASLARVLAREGGYTNHPSDPGGPTNFGITIADYRRYLKPSATANFGITIADYRRYLKPSATAADVRAMRLDEAKTIYKAHTGTRFAATSFPQASTVRCSITGSTAAWDG
jgi:lysozyme family protein